MQRRLLLSVLLMATLSACGGGLSESDKALCEDLREINVYMDVNPLTENNGTSAKSIFTALQGAEDEDLAQVGRDYLAAGADPMTARSYEERASAICFDD